MHKLRLPIWIFAVTLLEACFLHYIKIGNTVPNLFLVFSVTYAYITKDIKKVMRTAVITGIIADCLSGRIFGNFTAVILIASVLMYVINDCVFKNGFIYYILLMLLISIIGSTLFYVINISALRNVGYLYSFFNIILPESCYNTVIGCIVYPILKKTMKKGRFK